MFRTEAFTLQGGVHYSRPAMMLDMINDICAELKTLVPQRPANTGKVYQANKQFLKYCESALYSNYTGGYSLTAENGINVFDMVTKFGNVLVYNPNTSNANERAMKATMTIRSVTSIDSFNINLISDSKLITDADMLANTKILLFDKKETFRRKWKAVFKVSRAELNEFTRLDNKFYSPEVLSAIAGVDSDKFVDIICDHIKSVFMNAFGSANTKPFQLTHINLFSLSILLFHTAILSNDIIAVWMSIVTERNITQLINVFRTKIKNYNGNSNTINKRIAVSIEFLATSACGQALKSNKDMSFSAIFPAIFASIVSSNGDDFYQSVSAVVTNYLKRDVKLIDPNSINNYIAPTTDVYYCNHLDTIFNYLKSRQYNPRPTSASKITNKVGSNLYLTLNRDELVEMLRFPNRITRLRPEDATLVRDGTPHLVAPSTPYSGGTLIQPTKPTPALTPAPGPIPIKPIPVPVQMPVYNTGVAAVATAQYGAANSAQSSGVPSTPQIVYDEADPNVRRAEAKKAIYTYWDDIIRTQTPINSQTIGAIFSKAWGVWLQYDNLPSQEFMRAIENDLLKYIPRETTNTAQGGSATQLSSNTKNREIAESAALKAWGVATSGKSSLSDDEAERAFYAMWTVYAQYSSLPSMQDRKRAESELLRDFISNGRPIPSSKPSAEEMVQINKAKEATGVVWLNSTKGRTNLSDDQIQSILDAMWNAWAQYAPLPPLYERKRGESDMVERLIQPAVHISTVDEVSEEQKKVYYDKSKEAALSALKAILYGQRNPSADLITNALSYIWKVWVAYSPLPSPADQRQIEKELLAAALSNNTYIPDTQLSRPPDMNTMGTSVNTIPPQPVMNDTMARNELDAVNRAALAAQAASAQGAAVAVASTKESLTNRYRGGHSAVRKTRPTTYSTHGTQTRSGFTDLDLRRVLY